jgi:hypothetical protein
MGQELSPSTSAVMACTPVREMIEINASNFAEMDIATPFALG